MLFQEWEVLLLSKLEWDMCSIIAFDFVEHIIQRLAGEVDGISTEALRSSSEALITMCSGHGSFTKTSPCLIASACVYSTLKSGGGGCDSTSSSSDMSIGSDTNITGCHDKVVRIITDITQLSQVIYFFVTFKIRIFHLTSNSLLQAEIETCSEDVDAMVKQTLEKSQDNLVLSPSAVTSTPRRLRGNNC